MKKKSENTSDLCHEWRKTNLSKVFFFVMKVSTLGRLSIHDVIQNAFVWPKRTFREWRNLIE